MTPAPMRRPASGTHVIDPDDAAWLPTDTPGFWLKPLLEDPSGGTTSMMKIDAGAFAASHQHDQLEEIFVVSGQFHDEHRTYTTGQYCVRAAGEAHTAGSTQGGVVLLVYRP